MTLEDDIYYIEGLICMRVGQIRERDEALRCIERIKLSITMIKNALRLDLI